MNDGPKQSVPALRFEQWLDMWDDYDFDASALRRKPNQHVYMFSMSAARLRQLCDVYKRAGVHQYGLRDKPDLRAKAVPYPKRKLLGVPKVDRDRLLDILYENLARHAE